MIKLSLITLNYNTKALTIACADSLFSYYSEQFRSGEFELIIVDNDSHDDSLKEIKKQIWFPKIRLVENKENYGFSKGNNIGAVYAKGETLLFLNSDTEVQDSGIIKMNDYLREKENIGILGGKLQNTDGTYQPSAGVFYTVLRVFLLLIGGERLGKLRYSPEKIEKVDWVSGAMLMIKKDLFEKLEGFDENLFMYMEDMELCFRVKKEKKSVVFYPECVVKHMSHGSSSRSFAIVHIYKGLLYFFKKHTNLLEYSIVKLLLIAKALLLLVIGTVLGKKTLKETYTKALHAAL